MKHWFSIFLLKVLRIEFHLGILLTASVSKMLGDALTTLFSCHWAKQFESLDLFWLFWKTFVVFGLLSPSVHLYFYTKKYIYANYCPPAERGAS